MSTISIRGFVEKVNLEGLEEVAQSLKAHFDWTKGRYFTFDISKHSIITTSPLTLDDLVARLVTLTRDLRNDKDNYLEELEKVRRITVLIDNLDKDGNKALGDFYTDSYRISKCTLYPFFLLRRLISVMIFNRTPLLKAIHNLAVTEFLTRTKFQLAHNGALAALALHKERVLKPVAGVKTPILDSIWRGNNQLNAMVRECQTSQKERGSRVEQLTIRYNYFQERQKAHPGSSADSLAEWEAAYQEFNAEAHEKECAKVLLNWLQEVEAQPTFSNFMPTPLIGRAARDTLSRPHHQTHHASESVDRTALRQAQSGYAIKGMLAAAAECSVERAKLSNRIPIIFASFLTCNARLGSGNTFVEQSGLELGEGIPYIITRASNVKAVQEYIGKLDVKTLTVLTFEELKKLGILKSRRGSDAHDGPFGVFLRSIS